ncbi:hypothetical protein C2W62_26365 [Candidatus Entotheonella serta]|nr:hypothetical protein C2W62_26365 [Candidatus Entotheonella serta]
MNMKPYKASESHTEADCTGIVRELGRGGRTAILFGLAGQVVRLVMQVMFGRILGAQVYGLYTLGRSALDILSRFSLIGLQNGVVHFLAIYDGEGDDARVRGIILTAIALVAGSSGLAGLGLWWASDWTAHVVFDKPELTIALRGFVLALPFYSMLLLLTACARGLRHIGYFSGMTQVVHPLIVLIFVAGSFAMGMQLDGVLWGFGLSTALACVLMFLGLRRLFPSLLSLRQGFHFAGSRVLTFSAQVLFKDLSSRILTHLDRLMLGILGVASDVGIYGMSAFIGHRIDFFQRMFNSIFAPMIADLYNQGKRSEMVRIFQTVSKWTLLLTLPVFFTFVFLGYAILELFGREFNAGWATLIVLSLGNLINIGVGPVGHMLIMTGRPGLELINSWASGISNIILNLWLIPRYGAFGAAIATAMTVTMLNLIRLSEVYHIHRCYPFRLGTLKVLSAFIISGSTMWLLADIYEFALTGKLVCLASFLAIYPGLLFALGWDEEDQLVLHRLRRRFGRLLGS